ncbi:alpha/beta fold hydrolase [Nocardiopsis dassonvillei]|uniref:Alpha/beta hydrolase fold protein n=1 Tax=Nocardiopsis dassonvillei (strain ATCC 23218 / DSM 43111 / CIP 107115 / JCM 7437 / KCTC 9190 / NBRC 14626 / NCTC 10488 / NRRL B-5397 / IMRU 509) TaxID=446468 RepID=D7B0L8_NOCDD|nr:alpha/beta hydrolase [Nocardiopsis dassonvillei]ADH66425.1 alpha/beta hydrolase fold protein [Nocardiopsis dassonvillei subsp. dassonvillei DSM 43111]APC34739.1 alpha/beta hydrolase [Nocardiopsis dassonvillei]NKY77836.1 alpha/beta hydrolase [Nocardiopsis dassonvillei]VEI92446.1 short chain dehydrogenase [Nocardiopsis dassonvillei]
MTIVFVHGVPETPSLWNPLRALLPEDSVALRLPGFGSPRPAHMRGKEDYAAWLAEELRAVGGPIDLVGHDWGAHLAMRVVSAYDVPVRSWVSDVAHGWHPDYRWHDAATLWQSSPEGEESLAGLRGAAPGSGGTFGDVLQPRGMSPELAREVDRSHDEEMSAAVLALYRSAWPNFHADWGRDFDGPAKAPGLLLAPTGDPMAHPEQDREVARRLGARFQELDGLTHYWMLQDPERGARVLRDFWASPDA